MPSPYDGLPPDKWEAKTRELITAHPLKTKEIAEVALKCWEGIFTSNLAGYQIGKHIFPKPQIMGFFLHELIALEFAKRYPGIWRGDETSLDKDLVYIPNIALSVELKSSTHRSQIFGNRSYAQAPTPGKKSKDGYYIAINFEKFTPARSNPKIVRIRFGWLEHGDWVGQKSPKGQQAHLKPESDKAKLLLIYDVTTGIQAQGLPAEPIGPDEPNGDADELTEDED